MTVGELARRAGVNPSTVRYYEGKGLLAAPQRTASGYRRYEESALERLRFIVRGRALGLSLKEIQHILAVSEEGSSPCGHVAALLDRRIAQVRHRIRQLEELRRTLRELRSALDEIPPTPPGQACVCGVIGGREGVEPG